MKKKKKSKVSTSKDNMSQNPNSPNLQRIIENHPTIHINNEKNFSYDNAMITNVVDTSGNNNLLISV